MAFGVEQSKNEMQLKMKCNSHKDLKKQVWCKVIDRLTKKESSVLTHSAKTSFLEWVTFSVKS